MKTVKNLCFIMLVLFFAGCSSNDDEVGDWAKQNTSSFPGKGRTGAVAFTINGKSYVGLGIDGDDYEMKDFWVYNGSWKAVDDFPGAPRYGAVAFSDGKYGYVGLGYADNVNKQGEEGKSEWFSDFYRFDPTQATGSQWTKMPDFPGKVRRSGVAFYVSGKGYVGMGRGEDKEGTYNDFYTFNPGTNTWETEVMYYGSPREGAVAFVIGESAYICTGRQGESDYVNDVLKFTPTNEIPWEELDPLKDRDDRKWDNDYPKIKRAFAVAFVIGSGENARAYLATGSNGSLKSDCWEFNPFETSRGRKGYWDEVTNLPAGSMRQMAVGFTFNDLGYITLGGTQKADGTFQSVFNFTPGIDDDDQNDD